MHAQHNIIAKVQLNIHALCPNLSHKKCTKTSVVHACNTVAIETCVRGYSIKFCFLHTCLLDCGQNYIAAHKLNKFFRYIINFL